MFNLALNIKAGEFTRKKRTAEVALERFPELAIVSIEKKKRDG